MEDYDGDPLDWDTQGGDEQLRRGLKALDTALRWSVRPNQVRKTRNERRVMMVVPAVLQPYLPGHAAGPRVSAVRTRLLQRVHPSISGE